MGQNSTGETTSVDTLLESSLESVDAAEAAVMQVAVNLGFDEDDLHRIGMAVRETVVNAVVHGNRYNARKKVHLTVTFSPGRLRVVVTDEGMGFDPDALPDPLEQENLLRQSGRGILLCKAFVDEYRVRRLEPQGTEVQLVKLLPSLPPAADQG